MIGGGLLCFSAEIESSSSAAGSESGRVAIPSDYSSSIHGPALRRRNEKENTEQLDIE